MSHKLGPVAALILAALCALSGLYALVPPHPKYAEIPSAYRRSMPEGSFSPTDGSKRQAPNNILVLRVAFSDLGFISTPQYPDSLAHDDAFFERWMLHLADFYSDASKGNYTLEYTLWPDVFTMSQPMAYYGADGATRIDAKVPEMLVELTQMADPVIDFSAYGGIIIFHAGAGQETDINELRRDSIWSTFVTRRNLQASLDPENDDYQGIPTSDGIYLKNIVIVPEHQFHDYFPVPPSTEADSYIFSLFGVLAHQFSHLLGLPTLFDNDSSNGQSQGVGNWCILGTGVWNANGYVPAQLSAWGRVYMGWDQPYVVNQAAENLIVDYFLNPNPQNPTVYKVPISDKEYFLVENRQQNPDGSTDPYSGAPSFSFKLLPGGEQDYYAQYPERPFFNFMKNRYKGSEWDFMLPGLGGPLRPGEITPRDGSGILIWHIDESIMDEYFDPGFEINRPNGNALHKAVDLEEADGIQHMDTALFDYYMYGGPYDSFRQGNNDYFGQALHNGLLSLPMSESYYGGVPLEVYEISASSLQMSFSVRLQWSLDALYEGVNPFGASWLDLDQDDEPELFYAMPDGRIYAWEDETLASGFPIRADSLAGHYTYLEDRIYLATQVQNLARLRSLEGSHISTVFNKLGYYWAAQMVETPEHLIALLQPEGSYPTEMYLIDKADESLNLLYTINSSSVSNPALYEGEIFILSKAFDYHSLHTYDLATGDFSIRNVFIPPDSTVTAIFVGKQTANDDFLSLIVQCSHSVYLYHLGLGENHLQLSLADGFPFIHDEVSTAPLSMGDLDGNGSLDIVLPYNNGVMILDRAGALMGKTSLAETGDTSFSSSVLITDIDGDGKMDIVGSFSRNRLAAWGSDLRLKSGYPVSFPQPSRNMPIIGADSEGDYYLWIASDNGKVFRNEMPAYISTTAPPQWHSEYANLQRTAHFSAANLGNQYESTDRFVAGELYFFPNPLSPIYGNKLKLSVMPNQDTELELRIYDISGALIYNKTAQAKAYLRNREIFDIPASNWSSGVYIAVIKAAGQSHRLRFAIQK